MSGQIRHIVSFIISDDNLDPLEITKMLGVDPDKAHRKGDPNTSISKKGKLINFSPFNTGLWRIESKEDAYVSLDYHLKTMLLLLYPLKEQFSELSNREYKMDMFCSVDSHGVDQPGFAIGSDILLKMGELNIGLSVCIY